MSLASPNNKLLDSSANNRPWIHTNHALGTFLTLIMLGLIAYLLLSPWVFRPQRDGFFLGFMPLVSVGLMLLLSLGMIFDQHGSKQAREGSEAEIVLNWTTLTYALVLLMVMTCYFVAVLGVGYLLSTPIFLFFGVFALGARPWGLILFFAVLMTILIYLLLTSLGTVLPEGILFK